jgi:hypothetical protein
MCKRAGLLVGFDIAAKRALVTRADCDSWNCPECAARMREKWILRAEIGARALLADGLRLDFVTITSHEKLKTFAATEVVWREAWDRLYKAIRRKAEVFEYMVIPEKHKDGRMHVHALWTAGISQKWLKDNARKRGLGFMADVRRVQTVQNATRYVTKYIGKDLGDEVPPHFRRVRVSRNWAEIPIPVTDVSDLEWCYVGSNGALSLMYERCRRESFDLIDLSTGAFFDDVDLGTIVWNGKWIDKTTI